LHLNREYPGSNKKADDQAGNQPSSQ